MSRIFVQGAQSSYLCNLFIFIMHLKKITVLKLIQYSFVPKQRCPFHLQAKATYRSYNLIRKANFRYPDLFFFGFFLCVYGVWGRITTGLGPFLAKTVDTVERVNLHDYTWQNLPQANIIQMLIPPH